MARTMQQVFSMLRSREEVLNEIQSNNHLKQIFENWEVKYQEEFLDICSGAHGVKMLYDTFFKEILNPDVVPERLEEVLSLILQTDVKILKVLPNDSARIAAENSLLVMDIVVELADGSIANVEVQRIGYQFPGQRSACYSSDLLLRQYKRVRGERGKQFQYRDIKKVYTIVFLERSTQEFHNLYNYYIHRGKQVFDTGLELELLQEYVFVALDIYREKYENNSCSRHNRLEAWLTFLSDDRPEEILALIEEYPEFQRLYEEVYCMCRNTEEFMGLFSKELAILDSNTVEYMIDEMQQEIDEQRRQLQEKDSEIDDQKKEIDDQKKEIDDQKKEIDDQKKEIDDQKKEIAELKRLLEQKK